MRVVGVRVCTQRKRVVGELVIGTNQEGVHKGNGQPAVTLEE